MTRYLKLLLLAGAALATAGCPSSPIREALPEDVCGIGSEGFGEIAGRRAACDSLASVCGSDDGTGGQNSAGDASAYDSGALRKEGTGDRRESLADVGSRSDGGDQDSSPPDAACPSCECGEICIAGACVFIGCDGKQCGSDGCGGACRSCPECMYCEAGVCVPGFPPDAPPCHFENEYGVCSGVPVCSDGGDPACDAPTPGPEQCDGVDNDCDGETDEDGGGYFAYALCDDGNPCTDDDCEGSAGCHHWVLDGDECKDGDPCTVADHCDQGLCLGEPVICDDGNPCTSDACDPIGGCQFKAIWGDCDDGDPCTLGDHCTAGAVCIGEPIPGCTPP